MKRSPSPSLHGARRAVALIGAAALLAGLSACAPSDPGPAGADPAVGTWGTPGTEGEPYLTLNDGGQLDGSDGCNALTGSWEAEGDEIDFDDVTSTLMACEGVDTWLGALESATLSGDTMTVRNEGGAVIGTLERAE